MKIDVIIDKWLDELCPGDREHFEERAAIMHHCGGLPKERAEELAKAELETYRTMCKNAAKADAEQREASGSA